MICPREHDGLPEVGRAWTTRRRTIAESDLVGFSALTGDWHPQHADAEWAAGSRFGERVLHGMATLSYAVGLADLDPDRVVALRGLDRARFRRPVKIGDTIRARLRVCDVRGADAEHALVALALEVRNQRDEVVARARLEALWRATPALGEEDGSADDGQPNLVLL